MNVPGVALLLALFISNALALYFLYNDKVQFSGVCNIVSLCLTVALAYCFQQMRSIATVVGVFAAIVAAIVIIRMVVMKKLQGGAENDQREETEGEEVKDENN